MRSTVTFLLTILSTLILHGQVHDTKQADTDRLNSGKWITTRHKAVYVIGDKDLVEFSNLSFSATKPTNDSFVVFTSVKNLSTNEITINVLPQQRLKVEPRAFRINEQDSTQIYITTTIPAGQINEIIKLASKEWALNLKLDGFGYQLSTDDFGKADKKQILGNFYYFRTGDEYQMEISKTNCKKAPRYVPLSKHLVEIDLDKGTYVLTIVGPAGRKSKEIEIE